MEWERDWKRRGRIVMFRMVKRRDGGLDGTHVEGVGTVGWERGRLAGASHNQCYPTGPVHMGGGGRTPKPRPKLAVVATPFPAISCPATP